MVPGRCCPERARFDSEPANGVQFIGMIAVENVDGLDRRHAVAFHIFDLPQHVDGARFHVPDIAFQHGRRQWPAGDHAMPSAVQFEGAYRDDRHGGVRSQPAGATLDVEKLLRPDICTEAGFGDQIVAALDADQVGQHAAVALGDVGERPRVHQSRCVLQGLQQVGPNGIFHQDRHGAGRADLSCRDRFTPAVLANDDSSKALPQVLQRGRHGENGHHFTGHRNVKPGLAQHAVPLATHAHHNVAQGTVIHVQRAPPGDAVRVDIQGIAAQQPIVDHGRQQIVGCRHGVNVAG